MWLQRLQRNMPVEEDGLKSLRIIQAGAKQMFHVFCAGCVAVSDVRLQAGILHFVIVFTKQLPFGKCRFIYQIRKLKSA